MKHPLYQRALWPLLAMALGTAVLLFGVQATHTQAKNPPPRTKKAPPRYADMVITGGNIVTMDPAKPRVAAIAIVGDRIAALGSDAAIRAWVGPKTKKIDAKGKMILPGLIESHGHLLGLGRLKSQLNLVGTKSAAHIAGMVKKRAKHALPGAWIVGRGWDQNDWPTKTFPNHTLLTKASPNHPVYLRRIDGHAAWLNEKALALAGITPQTKSPKGGRIIHDAKGVPTGVLIDNAMALVSKHIPKSSRAQNKAALEAAIKACLKVGLTSFQDAGTGSLTIKLLKELMHQGKLDLRIYAMLNGSDKKQIRRWFAKGPEVGLGHHFLTIRSIKHYADGALGSRGAALLEPYADKPKQTGLPMITGAQLTRHATQALQFGFQLAVHAIGDKANRQVLDAYEAAMRSLPWRKDPRFRVEHAQILAASDIPRFAKLGVIPSMQPTHSTSDMPWVHTRIGKRRAQQGAYVWQSLLKTGARIAAGSDAPVESVNPFWGIYAAITRQDHKGLPKGGWYPKQRMTRMQALRAFTIDGAYAAFEETQKGSLKVGKLADLILIDRDIFRVKPRAIRDTNVLMTMVGGQIRHQSPALVTQ